MTSETAGCVTPSSAAALSMLPHCTTEKRTCRSRKRSRRLMRDSEIVLAIIGNSYTDRASRDLSGKTGEGHRADWRCQHSRCDCADRRRPPFAGVALGMMATLHTAATSQAYTLSDRG